MSQLSREKPSLIDLTQRVNGQLESVLRGLNDDLPCANRLQRPEAVRGSVNSLLAEPMERHIGNDTSRKNQTSDEAAKDLAEFVRA